MLPTEILVGSRKISLTKLPRTKPYLDPRNVAPVILAVTWSISVQLVPWPDLYKITSLEIMKRLMRDQKDIGITNSKVESCFCTIFHIIRLVFLDRGNFFGVSFFRVFFVG
jgi:hypothetical protein